MKTIAAIPYRKTDESPYTAIVGAGRKLATDDTVMNASADHVRN
jgi:hypothetical protein